MFLHDHVSIDTYVTNPLKRFPIANVNSESSVVCAYFTTSMVYLFNNIMNGKSAEVYMFILYIGTQCYRFDKKILKQLLDVCLCLFVLNRVS